MAESEQTCEDAPRTFSDPRRIVVVGPCAAGKSTLVSALQSRGYDARVSGQEHSEISTLWQHAEPDVLVLLDVDITAVRERRGGPWPEWLHDLQVKRLTAAAKAADLAIDTTAHSAESVIERVVTYLEDRPVS
jgi:ATPase subunit of ABC transporter with duplicated ATPase domains